MKLYNSSRTDRNRKNVRLYIDIGYKDLFDNDHN